jgi:hypothetical protein
MIQYSLFNLKANYETQQRRRHGLDSGSTPEQNRQPRPHMEDCPALGHLVGFSLCHLREVVMDDAQAEMHQMMQERMQMLEEALDRAKSGVATEDDWNTIRIECGLSKRPIVTLETLSIRSE